MLGYREVNGSISSDKDAQDFITFMETNKNILDFSNRDEVKEKYKEEAFNLYDYYDVHSCFVSDSIIITYKPKEVDGQINEELKYMHSANALFIICMRLQTLIFHCFTEKGIFLRGGISSQYAYIKDSFAVGEGVIEAYMTESVIAKHPRIALHPNVGKNEKLMEKIELLSNMMYGGKSLIQRDAKDGILFLDYIGSVLSSSSIKSQSVARAVNDNPLILLSLKNTTHTYVNAHYNALKIKIHEIENRLKKTESDSVEYNKLSRVLSKFIWLKEYHNQSISSIKEMNDYMLA